ncbi:MAG TPA: diacylglycerol kinase family protein [Myxococcaceae bacterium]|nr:diacylglycerol kinase family protein [Myxococcaceae bacterium]
MLDQSAARTTGGKTVPSSAIRTTTDPRVAVLLNTNARRVTERVIKSLTHVVPEEDLFLSRSEPDTRRIVQTVLDRRYGTVFCGGGDGTFMSFTNEFFRQLEQRSPYHVQRAPRFGVLKLGTGNGLAALVQASSLKGDKILDDVLRARAGEVPGYRRVDLLRVNGKRAVFSGMGVDGKILNDYIWVKDNLAKGLLKKMMTGGAGYFSAVTMKTIPYFLSNPSNVTTEVFNGRTEAYRVGPDGKPVGAPIAPGALIFRGEVNFAAASTIPFYGYGLKMFPFADQRRGFMHLRLAAVTAPQVVLNLPKLWAGKWFADYIHDFHVADCVVRCSRPMPLQIGGDAEGYHEQVAIDVAPEQVELVDFTGAVN